MALARRMLEGLASGLLVALMAPAIAAVLFVLHWALFSAGQAEAVDTRAGSLLLLAIGVAAGAYLVGAIPAFLAGLVLPSLRRYLPPWPAALATGLLGTLAYASTFGSHLIPGSGPIASMLVYALPAFGGVALAALWALRIERRHAHA